jgi:hypothetical protein
MKYAVVYEQSSAVILARVRAVGSSAYLVQASTNAVTVNTYNASTGDVVVTSTPAVEDVILDELATDDRWREDETGYNVAIPLTAANFPDGNTNYQVEVLIQPNDGYDIRFAVPVRTINLFSV